MDHALWIFSREAERAYQESSADTIDAWLAREVAETAYSDADRTLQVAQEIEACRLAEWVVARETAERAYAASCEHDMALGA